MGTTTWVELRKEDAFSEDAGILLAIAKKFLSYTEISNAIENGKSISKKFWKG